MIVNLLFRSHYFVGRAHIIGHESCPSIEETLSEGLWAGKGLFRSTSTVLYSVSSQSLGTALPMRLKFALQNFLTALAGSLVYYKARLAIAYYLVITTPENSSSASAGDRQ